MAPAEAGLVCTDAPMRGMHREERPQAPFRSRALHLESANSSPMTFRRLCGSARTPTWTSRARPPVIGPDEIVDDEIQLVTTDSTVSLNYVMINLEGTTEDWETSPDLDNYANAEVIGRAARRTTFTSIRPTTWEAPR